MRKILAAILLMGVFASPVSAANSISVSPTHPVSSETVVISPEGIYSYNYTGDRLYMTISIPKKYDCDTHRGCARVEITCTQFGLPSWYGEDYLGGARTGSIIFGTFVNGTRYASTVPGETDCIATVYRRDGKNSHIILATYVFTGTL